METVEEVVETIKPIFQADIARDVNSPHAFTPTAENLILSAIAYVQNHLLETLTVEETRTFLKTNGKKLQRAFDPIIDEIYTEWVLSRGRRAMLAPNHPLLVHFGIPFIGGTAYRPMASFEGEDMGWYFIPDDEKQFPSGLIYHLPIGLRGLRLRSDELDVFKA